MPKPHATVIDRLEQMLNDKDAQISELQDKLDSAKHETDWHRHVVYEDPGKAPNPKRLVDYDRAAFLAERAKYIRALRRAGYEWREMPEHLNLVDGDRARQIHEQLDIEGWPPPLFDDPIAEKNAQISELQGKLVAAEHELAQRADWSRHVVYEDPAKAPNPELPVPRLEIRWCATESGPHKSEAIYSLVYRHLVNHIVFVSLGTTRSTATLSDHVRGDVVNTPFRDGRHFANELRQLKLPGFVIAGDLVYAAKLCSKCGDLEEVHRREPFGEKCSMGRDIAITPTCPAGVAALQRGSRAISGACLMREPVVGISLPRGSADCQPDVEPRGIGDDRPPPGTQGT